MQRLKSFLVHAGAVAALLMFGAGAGAQTYPDKPVRWVVGYPAGGGADKAVRLLAKKLGERLGQSVVVENRPGASTIIAAEAVARSAPDGYTLLAVGNDTMVFNPMMFQKLPYDPLRDFAPVALYGKFPLVLVVNPQTVAVDSVRALVERGKTQSLSYASPGAGTAPHLAGEVFKELAGVNLVHVAYKGSAPLTQDLLGGHIGVSFMGASSAMPQVQAGKLRALAVLEPTRLSWIPNVPTLAEAGVKGAMPFPWQGVVAPAGTPAPIIKRLHGELDAILMQPDTQAEMRSIGMDVMQGDPAQMAELVRGDVQRWGPIVHKLNISLDK